MKLSTETRRAKGAGLSLSKVGVSLGKATMMELENLAKKVLTIFYGGRYS